MSASSNSRWRRALPWVVSASTLAYVFGYATDWERLVEATRNADLVRYVALTAVDKAIFFLWWGVLQAQAVRRFVEPISTREVIAVRGGAELARTINGALGDAAFLYGIGRLAGGRLGAATAAFGIPFACHVVVLVCQASLSLLLLEGGLAANRDVAISVAIGWAVIAAMLVAARSRLGERLLASGPGGWLRNVRVASLLPFLASFALFAVFDVWIQGLAARAFGVHIDWWALAARIPAIYLVISLPSFGNYGTREIAWATAFSDFAPRDTLIAYAFATNTLFLLFHVLIGVIFLPRAIALLRVVRDARRAGEPIPAPLIHDGGER